MSPVARSRARAASWCGWSIHTSQIRSSVALACAGLQAARRRNSASRKGRSQAGLRARRAAIKARMSLAFNTSILVEVARGRSERSEEHAVIKQAACHEVNYVTIALDHALHAQEARAEKLGLLPLGEMPPDHYVHVPGLVLERDENHAACGVRSLPASDEARGARYGAVAQFLDLVRGENAQSGKFFPEERQRMAPEREAQARVVRDDVLAFARRRELRLALGAGCIERRAPRRARRRPVREAPVACEAVQGSGGGQALQILPVQLQIVDRCVGPARRKPASFGFGKPAHHAKPQAQRTLLERAVPVARVHVRGANFDAVAARVLHELRGRVKAHRLA